MKETYVRVEMEIIEFECEDIITSSTAPYIDEDGDNEPDNP